MRSKRETLWMAIAIVALCLLVSVGVLYGITAFQTRAAEVKLPDPTAVPTAAPTAGPTARPTEAPTPEPTEAPTEAPTEEPTEAPQGVRSGLLREGYTPDRVVVLSRHSVRSPFNGSGSILGKITPHEWLPLSSSNGELTLRGGVLETKMGQYFRKWLEAEGLFPENFRPTDERVRFYANSVQRTIATSKYFAAGLLPAANTKIETHVKYGRMDPVFTPKLTFYSDAYGAAAKAQILELFSDDVAGLAESYALLSDVIDMEQSQARTSGELAALDANDFTLILKRNAEPGLSGSLKTAYSVSDALILQYYEADDLSEAAFGRTLSFAQWKAIARIKDVYGDVLFTAPLVAVNAANPLLREIRSELSAQDRIFTFLCGHDSNLSAVLGALGAADYALPGALEKVPIGGKLVFARWHAPDGSRYVSLDFVYRTADEIRSAAPLDLANPPAVLTVPLQDLTANGDGLYPEQDFMDRLKQAITAYDRLAVDYPVR